MGTAQPTPKPNSAAEYVLIRQSDGKVIVMEKQKLNDLLLNS